MTRLAFALLLLIGLASPSYATGCTGTGNCYWVGGTGNASDVNKWATTSGGAPAGGLPGVADYANIDANSGGGTYTIDGSPTYKGLLVVNINKTDALVFSGNLSVIIAGTAVTLTGASVTNRLLVKSSVVGTPRTITLGFGTPSLTNVDFQDITASGSTPWTGTSLGDCLGNSGITFDTPATQTFGSTGTVNWSAATWTSRVPLPQDDVVINYAGGSATTLTADMPRLGHSIDFTGYTKTMSFASTPNTIFGNVTLASGATFSGTQTLTLAGRSAQTVTSATKTFPQAIAVAAFGGSYTQLDNFATVSVLALSNGTWDGSTFTFGALSLSSNFSTVRGVNGSGVWSFSGTTGAPWNTFTPTNFTVGATFIASATIKFTGAITAASFFGGGLTFGNFWWSNTAATGTLTIAGANTFKDFKVDGTTARTVVWPASITNTFTTFTVSGTAGNLISFTSSTPGTQAKLSKASGTVNSDYLSLTDSFATGGAAWYAGSHSVDVSGNEGWIFGNLSSIVFGARRF